MPVQPIRLIIVDDHDIMRRGLVRLLQHEPDLQIVGTATNGRQAVALARQELPDIILMDIVMDNMGGLEAARKILAEHPQIKVIMLTMYEERAFFEEALAAGASGYFLKGSPSDELVDTIRLVQGGGTFLAHALGAGLGDGPVEGGDADSGDVSPTTEPGEEDAA